MWNNHQSIPRITPVVSGIPILALSVPFTLENGVPVGIPSSSKVRIALSTVYKRQTPEVVEALKWALERGHVVDVDVQFDNDESSYESLEDTLSKASQNLKENSAIVMCKWYHDSLRASVLTGACSKYTPTRR